MIMAGRFYVSGATSIALWVLDVGLRIAWPSWHTTVWQFVAVYSVLLAACFTAGYCFGERKMQ